MSDLSQFERAVQAKLLKAKRRRKLQQDQMEQRTGELLRRSKQFGHVADHLVQSVIRPRIGKVTLSVGDGELLSPGADSRYCCVSRFGPAGRFPSTTTLGMAVSHDGQFETICLMYELEILPVPFTFEGSDQTDFPLQDVDEKRVIAWVDERLLRFVDTYLRLKDGDLPHEDKNVDGIRFAA